MLEYSTATTATIIRSLALATVVLPTVAVCFRWSLFVATQRCEHSRTQGRFRFGCHRVMGQPHLARLVLYRPCLHHFTHAASTEYQDISSATTTVVAYYLHGVRSPCEVKCGEDCPTSVLIIARQTHQQDKLSSGHTARANNTTRYRSP